MSIPKHAFIRGVAILPALVLVAVLGSVLVGVDGFKSMSKYGQTAAAAAAPAPASNPEETPGGSDKEPVSCDQKVDTKAPKSGDGAVGVGKKCVRGCTYSIYPPTSAGGNAKVEITAPADKLSKTNDQPCRVLKCTKVEGLKTPKCTDVDKKDFQKEANNLQKYNAEATAEKLANANDPKSILDEYKSSGGDQKALTDALNAKKESIQTEIGDYVSSDEELRNKTKAELEEMVRVQDNLEKQSKNVDKALALNQNLNDPTKTVNLSDAGACPGTPGCPGYPTKSPADTQVPDNRIPDNRGPQQRDPNAANPNRQPNTFGGQQGGGQQSGGGQSQPQQQQQQRTPYQSTPQKQTQTTQCPTDQNQYNQIVSAWQQQWSSYRVQYNSCQSSLSSGAYVDCGQTQTPPDQPCVPSNTNQCQQLAIAQQQQPSSSLCSAGTWTPQKSGECIVGWTCSANGTNNGGTTKPTASLTCGKQVVDSESSFNLTYKCTNATKSEGIGFSTKNATSGVELISVGTPSAETDLKTYTLKCSNSQESVADTCSVQVNRITPPIWHMIPGQTVKSGNSVTVGWITGGTNACVISSPDLPDFTEAHKNNPSANGAVDLPVLTNTGSNPKNITLKLNCTTKGGGSREWSTTVRVLP